MVIWMCGSVILDLVAGNRFVILYIIGGGGCEEICDPVYNWGGGVLGIDL